MTNNMEDDPNNKEKTDEELLNDQLSGDFLGGWSSPKSIADDTNIELPPEPSMKLKKASKHSKIEQSVDSSDSDS